jgi:hypothetical protein
MENTNIDLKGWHESVTIFRDGQIVAIVKFENGTISLQTRDK